MTFVAEEEGSLAGFTHCGIFEGLEPGAGEIVFMYVAPEYQRGSLGSRLMARAVATLTGLELTTAILWVSRDNERARRFYERVGWAHDGAEYDRQIGGWPIRILRYRRSLM